MSAPRKMPVKKVPAKKSVQFDNDTYPRPDIWEFKDGDVLFVYRSLNGKTYQYVFLKVAGKGWYATGFDRVFTDEAVQKFIDRNVMAQPVRVVTESERV